MKKLTKSILGATCVGLSACSGSVFEGGSDYGRILISADAAGMQAFSDYSNGIIENTKSTPDVKNSYWQHRERETAVKGLKFSVKKGGK